MVCPQRLHMGFLSRRWIHNLLQSLYFVCLSPFIFWYFADFKMLSGLLLNWILTRSNSNHFHRKKYLKLNDLLMATMLGDSQNTSKIKLFWQVQCLFFFFFFENLQQSSTYRHNIFSYLRQHIIFRKQIPWIKCFGFRFLK